MKRRVHALVHLLGLSGLATFPGPYVSLAGTGVRSPEAGGPLPRGEGVSGETALDRPCVGLFAVACSIEGTIAGTLFSLPSCSPASPGFLLLVVRVGLF